MLDPYPRTAPMKRFLYCLATLLLFSGVALAQGRHQSRENILVLVVDDMGVDKTGAYGFLGTNGQTLAPETPNIDRIAEQGLLFRNAWAAPACSTCRASMLTGTYPNRTGIGSRIPSDILGEVGLLPETLTVPDILPAHYASAVIGKWHLSGTSGGTFNDSGLDHAPLCGFDMHVGSKSNLASTTDGYFNWTQVITFLANLAATFTVDLTEEYATTRVTNDALRAIRAFDQEPFFLWVAYHAPHKPFHVPPAELIQSPGLDLNTNLGMSSAMIEALDTEIGRLLASIDPTVMARTTVIWFSDNGTQKQVVEAPWDPAMVKGTVYNGGVNVPFMVMSRRIPRSIRGQECERLIDITDFMPTIAEMLQVPIPVGIDGTSFLPYLSNPQAAAQRAWIFTERFEPNFRPQAGSSISQETLIQHDQTVRNERYKLVRKRKYESNGLLTTEFIELYDLNVDFYETQDLLDLQGNPPLGLQVIYDQLLLVLDQKAS